MRSRPQLPIAPLLLAIAALAPAAEPAPAVPPAAGTTATANETNPPGQAEVAAEAKYTEALALYRAGAFAEALDVVERAVALYPPHAGAQRLRSDVLAVLSNRENRFKMAATWFGSLQDIRTQETAVRLASLMERADKEMAAGDFEAAELDYDRVDIGIRSFPYHFEWGELPKQVQAKVATARTKARARDVQRQDDDRRAAADQARRQTEMQAEALRLKVDELMHRAQGAYDRKDYRRAEVEAWNAYELDRRREDARDLYLAARREGHYDFDVKYRDDKLEGMARVAEELHKSLIPQNELMVFPEDWQVRALRKPKELGVQKIEPWMAALNDRLEQRVTFDFQDASFEDVIAFLRQVTGVNIVVAPQVLAAAGGGTVTLRVRDMRFRDALTWILSITNLHMAIQNQALFISKDVVTGTASLRIYEIADLISPVMDFPGVNLGYAAGKGGGGLGGGAAPPAPPAPAKAGDLVEFIKKNVTPTEWDPAKNIDITERAGATLFVSHTPEGHKQIEQLLANLRNQSGLQVSIDVRLLDVRKNFFEEIGVEWQNNPANMIGPNQAGYSRQTPVGNDGSGYSMVGSIYQALPANATQAAFNGANKGLTLQGAMNTSSFLNTDQVNGILTATENESDMTTVNHPQVTCFNGQRANASFITQYAYIAGYDIGAGGANGAAAYAPQIQVLNFGDIIDVRPVVSSDRKYISMEVRPTSVTLDGDLIEQLQPIINAGGNGNNGGVVVILQGNFPLELPNIGVQTLRASVTMPDRGSLLLGGFNHTLRQRTMSGVPFLSHIPFLGRLFSRNGVYDENRKTFWLLSGTIVDLSEQEAQQ